MIFWKISLRANWPANATPSDLVALVNNIDRFPSAKAGRLVIVSSNKNKNKKRKKGQPKEDTTK